MKLALIGLGVMGGSLARALLAHEEMSLTAWAADSADREAAAAGGIRVATEASSALESAEVVVLATPLSTVPELAGLILQAAPADAALTDVASLQAPVLAAAEAAGLGNRWVTSHPLVGSERSGFDAARADLYLAAPVYLSDGAANAVARTRVETLWRTLGAHPEWIDAEAHDGRMAQVSHLPQLVATALADALAAAGVDVGVLGPGGRDTTRLAGSSPRMWQDLLAHADSALVDGLRSVAQRLQDDADALSAGETETAVERLMRAGAWREES